MIKSTFHRIAVLPLLAALFFAVPLHNVSATEKTGSWNYDQHFDSMAHVSVGRVTSTVNQVTDCTITWTGISIATGQSVQGSTGMRLPAYSGSGAAIVGRSTFPVTNFNGHATCN
jgi:hypothetical protein